MRDIAAEWAEVDAAEADARSAIDRLVARILSEEPISSKAGAAVASLTRVVGRSLAAALLRTEDPEWRGRLLFLLAMYGPPRDYETLSAVAEVADEDWDHEVRAQARQILEDVNWPELVEERYLSASKASG
jgi:hypothetical protein